MKNRLLTAGAASAAALLMLAPLAARADVTVETLTHIDEVTGLANHDSDTTDYFRGTNKREENLRKFTGAVLGAWQKLKGEDKGSMDIDIFIIDANKHYNVDPQKKVYSVESIYDPNQPTKAPPQGGTTQPPQQKQQQDENVKVTKNEFTVKDTGQTKNINGFDTREYLITWDYETLNTKTNETSKNLMTTDTWTSTDGKLAKAREAEMAYGKAYLQLMHLQPTADEVSMYGLGSGRLEVNGQDMKPALEKLKTIKGLPVSTDIRWEVSGTDAKGNPTTGGGGNQGQPQPSLDNALGSLFGHKADSSQNQNPGQGTPGMMKIFSSHIEVKSVDTGAVDKAKFEVPADYKAD